MGVCYSNIAFVGGLRPAMTASLPWASEFNFGDKGVESFWYLPPRGYRAIGELINLHKSKIDLTSLLSAAAVPEDGDDEDGNVNPLSRSLAIRPVHKIKTLQLAIRSGLADVRIEDKTSATASFNYPTVIADRCSIQKPAKYYFELTVKSLAKQPLRPNSIAVGLVDKAFNGRSNEGVGVGDCQHSWALDDTGRVSVAGKWSAQKVKKFKVGDTIGVAIEKTEDAYALTFYVNSEEAEQIGDIRVSHSAIPAVSLVGGCTVDINFGAEGFKEKVPEGYSSLDTWLQDRK